MYDELYEAWRKEKQNPEVQTIPRDFYARLADYMKRIREESRMLDQKTTKAKLMQREFENVKRMVGELIRLRRVKTLSKAMVGKAVSADALTEEERKFHSEILPLAESYQMFLKDVQRGRMSRVERKEKPQKMLVRFLREIPAIIGADMKAYGPFKPEDIATLPVENARILIKQGTAVEVEAK